MQNTQTIWQKILYSTFIRIFIGIAVCAAVLVLVQMGILAALKITTLNTETKNLVATIVAASLVLVAYTILYKAYEKRQITELAANRLPQHLLSGILLGAFLQALTIYIIYLNHGFSIISVNSFVYILPTLAMSFGAAIGEELIFRGVLFRILEEKLGSYWSLAISALFFGGAHFANPNSNIVASLGIAIQAGLLLGAAYIYTKNLWFPIAIHFAWDFTQAGIFGATTSGNIINKSLLTAKIQGSALISGGTFGPEGSIQATLFCLAAAIVLMSLNYKQGKIVKPAWKR